MYTFDDLMGQLQAARNGYRQPQLQLDEWGRPQFNSDNQPLYLSAGMPGYIDPDSVMSFNNGKTGNEGVSYNFNPQTNSFDVVQGDATSGFQRFNVNQQGTQDLGFEDYDRKGKWNQGAATLALIAAGGAAAAYGAGLTGAASASAGSSAAAAGSSAGSGMFGSALSGLTGTGGTGMWGNLLTTGAQVLANQYAARRQEAIARDQANAANATAQQAAEYSRFRPVNISSSLGGSQFQTDANGNVIGATSSINPALQGIQNQALNQTAGLFGNPTDVNTIGNQFFQSYLQGARPQQTQMFSSLQDRLAGQGLLGLQTNSGMGGGENPFYTSFLRATQMADNEAWRNSFSAADQLVNSEQNRGLNFLNSALGIDKVGQGYIDMGGVLGGRGSSAAAVGGQGILQAGMAGANAQAGASNASNAANNAMIQAAIQRIFAGNTAQQNQGMTPQRQSMGDMYGNVGW